MKHDLYIIEGEEFKGRCCRKCTLLYDIQKKRQPEKDIEECDGIKPEGIDLGGLILGN